MIQFTPCAKVALALARREADRVGHDHVGTVHLLLGLIEFGNGDVIRALQQMGIDRQVLRNAVTAVMPKRGNRKGIIRLEFTNSVEGRVELQAAGGIPYTPRVKKVLARADKLAGDLNHLEVGSLHLFLGLLAEGESCTAQAFRNIGVDAELTCREVWHMIEPDSPFPGQMELRWGLHVPVKSECCQ